MKLIKPIMFFLLIIIQNIKNQDLDFNPDANEILIQIKGYKGDIFWDLVAKLQQAPQKSYTH